MEKDIPIVKPFIHNGGFYIYDTNKDVILKVSKALYCEIAKLINVGLNNYNNSPPSEEKNAIQLLIKKGFFKSHIFDRVLHFETEYIETLVERCLGYLQLQITRDCNFMCRYCLFANDNQIERNHQKDYMTWATAKKCIDFFFEHSKDVSEVAFSFYGGEPLLNFEIIKKAVLYINDKYQLKKIRYFMTTNGSLLTQNIIAFLVENNFNLMISMDGPESIQNQHRKYRHGGRNTYNTVLKNVLEIRRYNDQYFFNNVTFNPVLFADESFDDVLKYYDSIGIPSVMVRKQYADVSGVDYLYTGFSQYANGTDINTFVSKYERIQLNNLSKNFEKKTIVNSTWHHNGACIPGVSKLFASVEGNYYPCEKSIESTALCIGNSNDGLDVKKIKQMSNIGKLTEKQCKGCWAMRLCNLCIMHCIDVEKDCLSSEVKQLNCDKQKKLVEKYFKSCL